MHLRRGRFSLGFLLLLTLLLLLPGMPLAESPGEQLPQQTTAAGYEVVLPATELPASSLAVADEQRFGPPLPILGGIGVFLALALIVLAAANSRKRWPRALRLAKV